MKRGRTAVFTAGAAICIIIALCIFVGFNSGHDYDKTIVINSREDAEAMKNANPDAVIDVRLQKLPIVIPDHGMFGIWGWYGDKLLAEYLQPYFKFDDKGKIVALASKGTDTNYDFDKNALYLVNPQNGSSELFQKTGSYNQIWGCMSADRKKVLLLEGYRSINGIDEQTEAQRINDRFRIYDFSTKKFTFVAEATASNKAYELTAILGSAAWSLDSKGVAFCRKASADQYVFTIYDAESGRKSDFMLAEKQRRFDYIRIIAVSKDSKKIWFRGIKGTENEYLTGYLDKDTESVLYEADLKNPGKEAQKLIGNVYDCKILSDEDTIIYMGNPNDVTYQSDMHLYSIAKNQSKLIAEYVMPHLFDVSKDEKKLVYISPMSGGYDINMLRLDSGAASEKTLLYKSGPGAYPTSAPSWNDDGGQVELNFFPGDNSQETSVQLCILTLKKGL